MYVLSICFCGLFLAWQMLSLLLATCAVEKRGNKENKMASCSGRAAVHQGTCERYRVSASCMDVSLYARSSRVGIGELDDTAFCHYRTPGVTF